MIRVREVMMVKVLNGLACRRCRLEIGPMAYYVDGSDWASSWVADDSLDGDIFEVVDIDLHRSTLSHPVTSHTWHAGIKLHQFFRPVARPRTT
jgi:hypothetical protein